MARVQVASLRNKQVSLPHTTYDDNEVTAAPIRFDQNGWAYVQEGVWAVNPDSGENERSLVTREPNSAEAHALSELYRLHGVVVFDDEAADEAADEAEEDEAPEADEPEADMDEQEDV